jgi:hypothetical protein
LTRRPASAGAFLYGKKQAFNIGVKERVVVLLGYVAQGGHRHNTGIRENNIELSLLPFDLSEEPIQITKVPSSKVGVAAFAWRSSDENVVYRLPERSRLCSSTVTICR